jgi:hypothetical protein
MSRDVKSHTTMASLSWGSIRKAAKFVYIGSTFGHMTKQKSRDVNNAMWLTILSLG